MNAIPTMYAGVQFRSRLEARWACFLDLLEVRWAYEPFDLAGYIPDFIIDPGAQILLEIKPAWSAEEMMEAAAKIDRSGWDLPAFVCGAQIEVLLARVPRGVLEAPDVEPTGAERGPWEWTPEGSLELLDLVTGASARQRNAAWRESGNRVQWKAPR